MKTLQFQAIFTEQSQIQQYPKTLQFSNTHKHANCQISEGGKVVECSGGSWYYCLCEQAIPKTGKIVFAFQMISGQCFMVGIGFRDIIQKNNYIGNCGVGYGSYLIRNNGQTYSHHNKDVNDKQLSFTYTTNDVIIMEVSIEHKYIKWTRQNNPLATVQLEIDTSISQELYPCVNIHTSKVKILDNIIICRQNYTQAYINFKLQFILNHEKELSNYKNITISLQKLIIIKRYSKFICFSTYKQL
ncbi:unnamed protein product [Paramecium primaurelia]|uniref:SPRY domain-containing protein n=1 Tax=Paramecium primaurelia TaxID=5886 RepID=A0A8S1PCV4_PARPR|nr:unnamed protein product [Paramecium primaurelia]